jgi:hypothetical protein
VATASPTAAAFRVAEVVSLTAVGHRFLMVHRRACAGSPPRAWATMAGFLGIADEAFRTLTSARHNSAALQAPGAFHRTTLGIP